MVFGNDNIRTDCLHKKKYYKNTFNNISRYLSRKRENTFNLPIIMC